MAEKRPTSIQEQLTDQKLGLLEAILDEVGLGEVYQQDGWVDIPSEALSLCYDIVSDDAIGSRESDPEELLLIFWLYSALEPDDCCAAVGIAYHTRGSQWDIYYCRDEETISEADSERVTDIAHHLELPDAQDGIPEDNALDCFRRIASYFKQRLELSRITPPIATNTVVKRKLFLNFWFLGQALSEDSADALYFLKGQRDECYQELRSEKNGERLIDILTTAEAEGRVQWADDGDEYNKIADLLERNGYAGIVRPDQRKYRFTNVARMLEDSHLPIEVVFQ